MLDLLDSIERTARRSLREDVVLESSSARASRR
jgi:hypothetical protein